MPTAPPFVVQIVMALAGIASARSPRIVPGAESFGLVALEAMACEVPVIATRVGGIPEVVEDGNTGYLFEVGDTAGMAQAALRLLGADSERERLGRRGREVAISRFSTDRVIPQYEDLYRRVIETAR